MNSMYADFAHQIYNIQNLNINQLHRLGNKRSLKSDKLLAQVLVLHLPPLTASTEFEVESNK